ncbi:MAG TPA: asparagine synthase (glutamine-hydrolyzing), partial [bacterium]|nr:asparagine synthase (glutamine-hydrolyzing) [bacterium]
MCGIAGILNFEDEPVDRRRLVKMAESIRHRGPDDDGFFTTGAFGMAMRRLSIIDLNTGAQPIFNEAGSVSVIFNGEIYNHKSLRSDLEGRGHVFKTASDTEVIAHLYEESGADFVHLLRGMFAIAIWDECEKRLLLIRDRLGVKPLYYAVHNGELIFGSEIKCLFAAADIPRSPDPAGIDSYLRTQYAPLDITAFKGVRKLRAGHLISAGASGFETKQYWEVNFPSIHDDIGEAEAISRFREMFMQSVEMRLMSDVPLGSFLSGGIDSGAVTAAMSRLTGEPVRAFTIGFGDEATGFSELDEARITAKTCGANFHGRLVR